MTSGMFDRHSSRVMERERTRLTLCLFLVSMGIAVLAGWQFDIVALQSIIAGWSTMKVNTAIGFVLCGTGLALANRIAPAARILAALLGLLLAIIAVATLAEYITKVDLGIDQLFYADHGTLRGSGHPGRMSPLTATAFLAVGPAILLLARAPSGRRIILAHFLAGYAGFIAFVATAGYAFGAEAFWGIGFYTEMAVHTAIGLLAVTAVTLMTRAEEIGRAHV
jgi:hypothetical protein